VWANVLLSLGQFRQILMISVLMLVLNGLLVAALIPLDGARGAAIATAIAEVVAVIVQALFVVRQRPQLRPSLRTLPFVALAAAAGLIPLALTGLPVIVRLLISTTLFGSVVLLTRTLPPELMDLAPWMAKRRGGD
jgi:Na+-driven multidrug efflux pump